MRRLGKRSCHLPERTPHSGCTTHTLPLRLGPQRLSRRTAGMETGNAAIPPHSQAPSPSDAATPSGGLADDERDEAAAPPRWPARASRWPVQRGGTGSPILARALADAR